MGEIRNFKDLVIWQMAGTLAKSIHYLVRKLPSWEVYSLCDQMRRAAMSIQFNIAEGHDRGSTKEFIRFLHISKGSMAELETQLLFCVDVEYLSLEDIMPLQKLIDELRPKINALIFSLRAKIANGKGRTS